MAWPAGSNRAEAEPCRLCAPERGYRLELPCPCRGCGDDGALRTHELPADPAPCRPAGGNRSALPCRHERISVPPDRRTLRRAEEAGLSCACPGAECAGDPAG